MSASTRLAALVVLALLTPSSPAAASGLVEDGPPLGRALLVGHRGAGSDSPDRPHPENSLDSMALAFEEGADLVEVDVQVDRRGEPILWHDDSVRIDGRKVPVDEVLREHMPAFVPTLDQALTLALDQAPGRRALDIELKVGDGDHRRAVVAAVVETLRERGCQDRVLVSSFDLAALVLVEKALPGIETGLLSIGSRRALRKIEKLRDVHGLEIEWLLTGRSPARLGATLERAGRLGVRVGIWTENDPETAQRAQQRGVEMVITDRVGPVGAAMQGSGAEAAGAGPPG